MSPAEARERLISRLEEAGATLLAMPLQKIGPQLRQVRWPETHDEGGGAQAARLRRLTAALPDAGQISRMDEVFGWIGLIPADRVLLRRIIHARALVSPVTGRHLYSWRKLGALLGADHKAVQRWHADGIGMILRGIMNSGKTLSIAN